MDAIRHLVATSLLLGALALVPGLPGIDASQAPQAIRKVDLGDYEPVVPWPKALPDTDQAHAG